ncbi:MAG: hypothetical protein P1T08_05015 [Acidimicrobiia bacterium]|nr:hypothetical protein [Acidimicrobiia bacterium]
MAFSEASVPVRSDLAAALRQVWASLAAPGTWWSGVERVAIAGAARGQATDVIPASAGAAARTVYADITATSRDWVDNLIQDGLGIPAFIEIIGIVSRLAAVDEFSRALGQSVEPLPDPLPGDPSFEPAPPARPGRSWLPTAGPASITQSLSLVPAESAAQEDLHGPLYLTYEQMGDLRFRRELTRPQMELVAARVSAVNECFY